MKRLAILFGMLAIALFTACGDQAQEGDTTTDQGTDETELAEVTIINGLEAFDIHDIYIDPSDEPWGEDRLGAEEILEPGGSFTVEIEQGTWDIQIIDEDEDTYTLWQVEVGPDGHEWNVTLDDIDSDWGTDEVLEPRIIEVGDGEAWISIVNDLGGYDIFYVYISPTDSEDWGEDWLGSEVLLQGDELIVHLDPGTYDIQIEDVDGDTYTMWELDVNDTGYQWVVTLDDLDMNTDESMGAVVLESGEGSAPVTIVNDLGSWDIYYVYVDPSDSPWGDDRLGADILSTESQITVWVDPGTYDMKVEDEDGDTYTLWGVEVGEAGYTWNVTLADMD
ncbi:MAG: hypothetical protein AVO35_05140 [Candidatus Aegiribacteria sp. MLS_C]|nr:MAG: hypothetical protein AVO35_05140 [Candidatus Aegiribacteria sp. MLS_C]